MYIEAQSDAALSEPTFLKVVMSSGRYGETHRPCTAILRDRTITLRNLRNRSDQ
jgi:hypothetical protein